MTRVYDCAGRPSRGRYVHGCRCDGCRRAERDYRRLYRLRRAIEAGASPADTRTGPSDVVEKGAP